MSRRGLRKAAVALLVGVGLAAPALASVPDARAATPAQADPTVALEAELFELINQARAGAGLAPLRRSAVLDAAAEEWSTLLASGGCPSGRLLCHRSRESLSAISKAAAAPGKRRWWAENVQIVGPTATMAYSLGRLMNSSGHRANLLRPATNLIGIGIVVAPSGSMFITQEFAEGTAPPHPCGRITRTLSLGSRNSQVRVLQCVLKQLGFYNGLVDGRFGTDTRTALKAFQASVGLSQSGKTYLSTRRALGVTT